MIQSSIASNPVQPIESSIPSNPTRLAAARVKQTS